MSGDRRLLRHWTFLIRHWTFILPAGPHPYSCVGCSAVRLFKHGNDTCRAHDVFLATTRIHSSGMAVGRAAAACFGCVFLPQPCRFTVAADGHFTLGALLHRAVPHPGVVWLELAGPNAAGLRRFLPSMKA